MSANIGSLIYLKTINPRLLFILMDGIYSNDVWLSITTHQQYSYQLSIDLNLDQLSQHFSADISENFCLERLRPAEHRGRLD
jgi:hypothetical protein